MTWIEAANPVLNAAVPGAEWLSKTLDALDPNGELALFGRSELSQSGDQSTFAFYARALGVERAEVRVEVNASTGAVASLEVERALPVGELLRGTPIEVTGVTHVLRAQRVETREGWANPKSPKAANSGNESSSPSALSPLPDRFVCPSSKDRSQATRKERQ